jgi:hypothetical protein
MASLQFKWRGEGGIGGKGRMSEVSTGTGALFTFKIYINHHSLEHRIHTEWQKWPMSVPS